MTGTAMIMDKGLGHKIWAKIRIFRVLAGLLLFMHLIFRNNTKFFFR